MGDPALKVLLVEEDESGHNPIRELLSEIEGFEVDQVAGYEATRDIRKREAGAAPPHNRDDRRSGARRPGERALEAGMDDYIAKPVRYRGLEEVLGRWVPGETSVRSGRNAAPEDIIDHGTIAGLHGLRREGHPDILGESADIFFSDAPRQIEAVREAVARSDARTVEFEHTL